MQFPAVEFSKVTVTSNAPSYLAETQSLQTLAASTGAHRFEFDVTTAWLPHSKAREVNAFLTSLGGQSTTFEIVLPLISDALNSTSTNTQTTVAKSAGSNTVSILNYNATVGDYIKFAGHNKAYQVVGVVGSTVTIYPRLLQNIVYNEAVSVNKLAFNVRLKKDSNKLEITKKTVSKISFKCIEVF